VTTGSPEPADSGRGCAPLPAWARFVPEAKGRWTRRWFNLILRLTAKRSLDPAADLASLRAMTARLDERFGWVEPGMRRTPQALAGVPSEWIDVPASRPDRVVLYLHGGAFTFRFPQTHAGLAARICARVAARALVVDYRLAPEHRHPAASDDCVAAYRALRAEGVPAGNIVLIGDSAGGNLVLGTLHRLKAAGEPLPACAVAMSPVVDFTLASRSLVGNARSDPIFTIEAMLGFRRLYACPEEFLDPAVSPLFGDWAGLPPLLFQVGGAEMLRDEAVRAAVRAYAAGTPVELEVYDRVPHVFQVMRKLPHSEVALDALAQFVRRRAGWHG
jgi:acetyl esterase/lipase